jgi:hypothetical protein
MNSKDRCPECSGGGLVPALGCNCDANTHTCTPAICTVRGGAGRAYEAAAPRSSLKIAEELACNYARALGSVAVTRGEAAAQVTQHPDTDLSNSRADSRADSRTGPEVKPAPPLRCLDSAGA